MTRRYIPVCQQFPTPFQGAINGSHCLFLLYIIPRKLSENGKLPRRCFHELKQLNIEQASEFHFSYVYLGRITGGFAPKSVKTGT